jgi:hypothetical protein
MKRETGKITAFGWIVWAIAWCYGMPPKRICTVYISVFLILSLVLILRGDRWYEAVPVSLIKTIGAFVLSLVFAKTLDVRHFKKEKE